MGVCVPKCSNEWLRLVWWVLYSGLRLRLPLYMFLSTALAFFTFRATNRRTVAFPSAAMVDTGGGLAAHYVVLRVQPRKSKKTQCSAQRKVHTKYAVSSARVYLQYWVQTTRWNFYLLVSTDPPHRLSGFSSTNGWPGPRCARLKKINITKRNIIQVKKIY